jgi:hypothetical protein
VKVLPSQTIMTQLCEKGCKEFDKKQLTFFAAMVGSSKQKGPANSPAGPSMIQAELLTDNCLFCVT